MCPIYLRDGRPLYVRVHVYATNLMKHVIAIVREKFWLKNKKLQSYFMLKNKLRTFNNLQTLLQEHQRVPQQEISSVSTEDSHGGMVYANC